MDGGPAIRIADARRGAAGAGGYGAGKAAPALGTRHERGRRRAAVRHRPIGSMGGWFGGAAAPRARRGRDKTAGLGLDNIRGSAQALILLPQGRTAKVDPISESVPITVDRRQMLTPHSCATSNTLACRSASNRRADQQNRRLHGIPTRTKHRAGPSSCLRASWMFCVAACSRARLFPEGGIHASVLPSAHDAVVALRGSRETRGSDE